MLHKTRTLKVGMSGYEPANSPDKVYPTYPRIRLQGNWIEKAGFKVGEQVKVYVTQNQIIIERN